SMDELLAALTQARSHIASQSWGTARGPDPLTGISPPGLLNPTPPVRSHPVAAAGTPGSVPLGSISSRVPNSTPRPISARVPHSIPPTPALFQTGPAVAKKRGPVIAMGAAVGVAIAVIGTAWFVKSHRAPAKVSQRPAVQRPAAPAEAAPATMTMQIELDGRRPAEPTSVGAAATPAVPAPAQPAPAQVAAETKIPAPTPARPAQKEQAKPAQASASKSAAAIAHKPEPV